MIGLSLFKHRKSTTLSSNKPGFTIVELLVVIVVIGILAAITIVSYTGISQKAKISTLQSDLSNASKQIKLFQAASPKNDYPTDIVCPTTGDTEICIKPSGSNLYTGGYTYNNTSNPKVFKLVETNGSLAYSITNSTAVAAVAALSCPTGYIVVPGSATYGTSDFCVMKYEAKNVGGVATSQAALLPWRSLGQANTVTTAAAACAGCHLITEAEWMTIAQNVLRVASNWDNGAGVHTVGTGYIYSGHNNDYPSPTTKLDADTNDSNGYYGTGAVDPSNQRRTLTLSNNEVIWDFAGNAWEWTSGSVQSPIIQPGASGGLAFRDWTAITNPGTLPINPSPAATGIAGASSWTTAQGIGRTYSNSDEVAPRGFVRGGSASGLSWAGVLSLNMSYAIGSLGSDIGFRVAK